MWAILVRDEHGFAAKTIDLKKTFISLSKTMMFGLSIV
jgi:hypothetical protein